jgi:hypothetical protein
MLIILIGLIDAIRWSDIASCYLGPGPVVPDTEAFDEVFHAAETVILVPNLVIRGSPKQNLLRLSEVTLLSE